MALRSLKLATFLIAFVCLPAVSHAAMECKSKVVGELAHLSVAPKDIKSTVVENHTYGGQSSTDYRIVVWNQPQFCSGHIVTTLMPGCFIPDSYTTGNCREKGAPHY